MGSEKTTASTREKLSKSIEERDRLEEENETLHDNVAVQQERIESLIALLGAQNLDEETASKLKEITGYVPNVDDTIPDDRNTEVGDGHTKKQTPRKKQTKKNTKINEESEPSKMDTPSAEIGEVTPLERTKITNKIQANSKENCAEGYS